jgi:chemotaxis response regulator CheB
VPKQSQARIPGLVPAATVLSVGRAGLHFRRRNQLLSKAGFHVMDANDATGVVDLVRKRKPDVVVIGHLIPPSERATIIRSLRELKASARVIMMYESTIAGSETADAILNVNGDPQDLVQTVRYLLSKSV